MNEIQITILLLFIISFSATFFFYILFIEYKKVQHLKYVKQIISIRDEDQLFELLEEKDKEKKKSYVPKIDIMIKHAGFNIPVALFLIIFALFSLAFGIAFSTFLRHWLGFIIGIPVGVFLFIMVVNYIISKRKKEFNRSLAVSISVLVKMMKNGIGFEQALTKSISVSSSILFKKIFEPFFQEKNTIGEEEAFNNMNEYVASKELLIFALAIKIGRGSGGQFSNTLEKVETTINYRKKMQEKVDVVTQESNVGSYIVVVIAIFLYFSIDGNFDGKLDAYFMNSEYGRFQLLGIGMWIFSGMMVNKWITRIER